MASPLAPILVTGANGHLGRGLIARIHGKEGPAALRAVVRSPGAADRVRAVAPVDTRTIDYTDRASLAAAAEGCRAVVHLVGIIKETRSARYEDAHERTCEALAAAAAESGASRIVYLSILGSAKDSKNACLASKGRAEEILLAGRVPACVLRVPMVLGPDDHASYSLRKQATAGFLPLVGGGRTLQQPIDADDVVSAVIGALDRDPPLRGALDLGGPECISQRDLVLRTAALHGKRPTIVPLPLGLVRSAVGILERVAAEPVMTRVMLDVLQHDDRVDPGPACRELHLQLTPLDETLRRYAGPDTPRQTP